MDLCTFEIPQKHVAARPDSWLSHRRQIGDTETFYFVVNLLLPGPPYVNTICYYKVKDQANLNKDTPFGKLFDDFIHGDDEYRHGRFKLVPAVATGPWVVKKTVGNTPAIMDKKLEQTYYTGEQYF